MSDLRNFFKLFTEALRDAEKADSKIRAQFNNSPELKRAKNCSPRTDLMLGTGNDRNGILARVLQSFLGLEKQDPFLELSYDRYLDFVAYKGNWFDGGRIALVTVEVENNLVEFKGTLSDLVRYQAHQKLGVFYDKEMASHVRRNRIEGDILDVFNRFQGRGFVEAENTEYMLMFGPEQFDDGSGIGDWSAIRFTTGSLGSLSDCWCSPAAQTRSTHP